MHPWRKNPELSRQWRLRKPQQMIHMRTEVNSKLPRKSRTNRLKKLLISTRAVIAPAQTLINNPLEPPMLSISRKLSNWTLKPALLSQIWMILMSKYSRYRTPESWSPGKRHLPKRSLGQRSRRLIHSRSTSRCRRMPSKLRRPGSRWFKRRGSPSFFSSRRSASQTATNKLSASTHTRVRCQSPTAWTSRPKSTPPASQNSKESITHTNITSSARARLTNLAYLQKTRKISQRTSVVTACSCPPGHSNPYLPKCLRTAKTATLSLLSVCNSSLKWLIRDHSWLLRKISRGRGGSMISKIRISQMCSNKMAMAPSTSTI